MRIKSFILLSIFLLGLSANAFANNLRISNVSIETRDAVLNTMTVEFDISWDNSWRNTTNYDAVWIVVKLWNGTYWVPAGLQNHGKNPSGSSPGTNKDIEIFVPIDTYQFAARTDGMYPGAFIYRKASGTGTVTSQNVRLKVSYNNGVVLAIADTATTSAKLIGVEMVYIPAEPFLAGDTSSTSGFKQGSADTDPWYIDSDAAIQVGNAATNTFYYTSDWEATEVATGSSFAIPGYFPTGYDAFWCMKYEISEGLWLDYFNNVY